MKIYCPKCGQVYNPPPIRNRPGLSSGVDGAAFGTTFPHLFLMTFANLVPDPLPVTSTYIPRVFGFRVHHSAARYPRGDGKKTSATNAATNNSVTHPNNDDTNNEGNDDNNPTTTTNNNTNTNMNSPSSALESTTVPLEEKKRSKRKESKGESAENTVKKRRRTAQS